jgi:hypothetical protein
MTAVIPEIRNLALRTSKNVKWHVIASIALAGSNYPEEVPAVLRYALQHDAKGEVQSDTARRIARETREGLVKALQLMYSLSTPEFNLYRGAPKANPRPVGILT